jgi:hypothetical protein
MHIFTYLSVSKVQEWKRMVIHDEDICAYVLTAEKGLISKKELFRIRATSTSSLLLICVKR